MRTGEADALGEVREKMLHPRPSMAGTDPDPVAVIHAANVAYLEAYRRNARLMALLKQVARRIRREARAP